MFVFALDSPPRRRSAGASLLQQNGPAAASLSMPISAITSKTKVIPPNRRNSVATISNMTSRKRMSLTLTKLDK